MALKKDSYLKDRYKIIDILGQGGMGAVYRANDENLGIVVAVKENLFTTEEYARQFKREANILASLRHSNMPRVFDHFEIKDQGQYLVMDYIVGEDLRQRMDRLGTISEEHVIITSAAICDALKYLHTRNPIILHRDIKPGNIKIDPEGKSYLVDFGLAKIVKGSEATTTGARAMTPGYSSPEQYGTSRTDARSDVYSLGATIYVALSGIIPEDGLARAMDQVDLTPLKNHVPKISRKLASVINKSLEIHPEDRFQTAEEFKLALLSSRISTRNIKKTDELTIIPPPEIVMAAIEFGEQEKVVSRKKPEIKMSSESSVRKQKKAKIKKRRNLRNFTFIVFVGIAAWILNGFPGIDALNTFIDSVGNEVVSKIEKTSTLPSETQNNEVIPPISTTIAALVETSTITSTNTPKLETVTNTSINTPTVIPTNTLPVISAMVTFTPIPIVVLSSITPTNTQIGISVIPKNSEKIVFASSHFGDVQIWQYNFIDQTTNQIFEIDAGACQPVYSPDGNKIAFISPCNDNQDLYLGTSIYTYDVNTQLVELLDLGGNVFDPQWSPDGETMLFTKAINSTQMQIMRVDLETNAIIGITDSEKINFHADWSNDGEDIVFSSSRNGGFHLYVMPNIPAASIQILSRGGGFNLEPTWYGEDLILFSKKVEDGMFYVSTKVNLQMIDINPINYIDSPIDFNVEPLPGLGIDVNSDMDWMAFESWPDGSHHNIYISEVDGTNKTQLTDDLYYDFDPSWKP